MIESKIGSRKDMIHTPGEIEALRDAMLRKLDVDRRKVLAAATIAFAQYDAEMARRARVAARTKTPHFHVA